MAVKKQIITDKRKRKGRQSPSWKGDKAKSEHTGHWRAQQLYPVMGMCVFCKNKKAEDRHHKNNNKLDNRRTNI